MTDRALELLFPGDGEMARRMCRWDWAGSGWGDPGTWPAPLRTAVRICLTSRFPMVIWWGPDLRMIYNDAYAVLLGEKHPCLGTPGREVWTEIWHVIGPMHQGVLTDAVATWSEDMMLPVNRHGYWEETYWTWSFSPLHDDDGGVRGVFTAITDTTERVVGERRLAALRDLGAQAGIARTAEEAARLVTASLNRSADTPYAAVCLRREGVVEVAAVTGSTPLPGGLAAWPVEEVIASGRVAWVTDRRTRFPDPLRGSWGTPPTEAAVWPLRGGTGAESVGAIVLVASGGRAVDEAYRTFFGLLADQTTALINSAVAYELQQRRAEELAALDQAKTTFFANVSHEFRTPLTLITGPVSGLRDRLSGADERTREDIETIHRNGLRLSRLVNTLLDFSRIEAGRARAGFEPVDISAHTAELASVFRAAMDRAGLRFEVDCPPLRRPVYLDREMWEKTVLNLLSNALKFTFEGTVRVSVTEEDDHAVLRVADTGIGIAESDLPRVFERFHRVPVTRARSTEGSGIGLALVRELVTLHHGEISATSVPDGGTTFTIRLPFGRAHLPAGDLITTPDVDPRDAEVSDTAAAFVSEAVRWLPADAERPVPDRPGADPANTEHAGDGRVLIADDNADMRDYLSRLLRTHYQVTTVGDGHAALAEARTGDHDLIISDVMMPGMDGLELLAALRAEPATAGLPVLLLSARAGNEAAVEGLVAGADDYLVKPFAAAELLARVRANIDLTRLRTEHARWRAALIESLQEGFFIADGEGTILEINAAFARVLGHGPEGLPYRLPYPWFPDLDHDPAAHARVWEAIGQGRSNTRGSAVLPLVHRDGRRLMVATNYSGVADARGNRMVVGTVRDVTAEHHAVQHDSALARVNQRLSSVRSTPEVFTAAVGELRDLWRARRALVSERDGDGLRVLAVSPPGRPALSPDVHDSITRLFDLPPSHTLTRTGGGSLPNGVGTTLTGPDGPLAVWLDLDPGLPFTGADETLLGLLCGSITRAAHRAHDFDQQHEVALALQRAVLGPARLPPGFAVRYEPATRPLVVGGDWYDAVELDDGRIGIAVGDCVGHGLAAAAAMGQLRSACRAGMLRAHGPADTLTALDRFVTHMPGTSLATLFCAVLDPATGRLEYSIAGHPPALLTRPDGRLEQLDGARSVPLGLRGVARPLASTTMDPGSVLLLYTDGLVERRGRSLDEGIDRAAALIDPDHAVRDIAEEVINGMRPEDGYPDDVALLVYRRLDQLDVSFPATPGELRGARTVLRRWLGRLDLDPVRAQDVLLAVGEACTNAIEHAYRDATPQRVRLSASVRGGTLRVRVTDTGSWRPPRPDPSAHRGRGLNMIREMMDEVSVDNQPSGTTIDMRMGIGR